MKKYIFILQFFILIFAAFAQTPLSRQINSFSELEKIYLRHLGLNDRNNNGVIDKGINEGYEEFTERYGNADTGFYINGTTAFVNNGRLESNEIINHYYVRIRFKPEFDRETTALERDVTAYLYANNIPAVWLDDRQGTVMNAVNRVLGEGWNQREVSEAEAVRMLSLVMRDMKIRGRSGDPINTGYYTLQEFVHRQSGYCFEAAQFSFWFFSQLKINSIAVNAMLTSSIQHQVIQLTASNRIFDYFKTSENYKISGNSWHIYNPLQSISEYYSVLSLTRNMVFNAEQAVIYSKYDLPRWANLFDVYDKQSSPNHQERILLGEFILRNIDLAGVVASSDLKAPSIKENLKFILGILLESYSVLRDRQGFNNIAGILNRYFSDDPAIGRYIERYNIFD